MKEKKRSLIRWTSKFTSKQEYENNFSEYLDLPESKQKSVCLIPKSHNYTENNNFYY